MARCIGFIIRQKDIWADSMSAPSRVKCLSAAADTKSRLGGIYLALLSRLWVLFTASFISLAPAQPDGARRLETVVVSATNTTPQIVAESLPLAETVITGRELDLAGIASVVELPKTVPNFSQSQTGARSYANTYAIRGLANTDFLSDPTVVLYVDDVPFEDVVSYTTDLLAVDRVEVLRGPQGSRFGKNSEAGVINVVTRQPTDVFEAAANASYATFDTQRYQASAAGPLAKGKLRFSLAGQYATSDGFIHNVYLGDHADEQEDINGRASLNWIPSDNWTVDVTATADQFNDGIGLVSLNGDPHDTMSDFNGKDDQSANSLALRVRGQLDSVTLASITAWRQFHLDPFKIDPDFSPVPGNVGVNTWDETQWTEELRLRPVSPPENWDWHAGFFFSTADSDIQRILDFVLPPPDSAGQDVVVQKQQSDTYALFGEVTRTFQDKFDVTLGLRLDYTAREWNGSRTSTFGTPSPLDEDKDFFNALPKLTLAYHVTDAVQIYGSTGLGFKPGGYSVFINDPALREFDSEHVWASEVGLKSVWLDGKLTAHMAVFYYDVDDYQVEQFGPGLSVTIANAPHAYTVGAEVELAARPATGLEFTGFFGYTDARLDSYTNPFNGVTVHDTHPPAVAEFNGGVAAQYQHRSGLFGRIEYVVVGDTFYDAANTSALEQSTYGLLNARVGFERGHFGVFLFGVNLTDEDYYSTKIEALNAGAPGLPQTFGVMVTAKY